MNDFNAVIEGMNFHNIGGKGFPDSIVVSNGGNIANGEYTDIIYTPDKHAHWIGYEPVAGEGTNTYKCSNCGEILQLMDGTPKENGYKYCPHCGARMNEVKNE